LVEEWERFNRRDWAMNEQGRVAIVMEIRTFRDLERPSLAMVDWGVGKGKWSIVRADTLRKLD
jgi:hypothetical protein